MSLSAMIDNALSPATRDRMLGHPRFRATAEAIAAQGLAHTKAQDTETLWLTKDLGRVALYISALILDASLGRVSVYDLLTAAKANGTCSRGRVLAFVQYARRCGRLDILPGDGHWTKRPLMLTPAFIDFARTRFWGELEVVTSVAPEARPALALREDDRAFRAILITAGQALTLRRDAFQADEGRLQPFLAREGGMRMLHELIGRQSADRRQFLQQAAISRSDLARRCGISRVHVNAILTDAATSGLLDLVSTETIVFSQAFSEKVERHFAFVMQMNSLFAQVVLQACEAESFSRTA